MFCAGVHGTYVRACVMCGAVCVRACAVHVCVCVCVCVCDCDCVTCDVCGGRRGICGHGMNTHTHTHQHKEHSHIAHS